MPHNTRHIVFDWNGTLLDDALIVYETISEILAKHWDHALARDNFFENYHIPFEVALRKMGVPDATTDEVMHHFHDVYEERAKTTPLRDGAVEVLNLAADNNIRCIILSNHIVDAIHPHLKRHGIAHHIADVLAYPSRALQFKDMTKGERLRRYFLEHDYRPENTIIIGDSAEEPEIAHQQGMVGVGITGGCFVESKLRQSNPHHLIHTLYEFKDVLHQRGFLS